MEKCYHHDYACACELPWVGMKRGHERPEGKLDAAMMEKRHRCDDEKDNSEHPRWKAVAAYAPSAGAKRGYELSEEEVAAESLVQRYKCNYWEDPACAMLLQRCGGRKAKDAAGRNQTDRVIKESDEVLASLNISLPAEAAHRNFT